MEECLLNRVAGFLVIADDPEGNIEHLFLVPSDQNRKSLGIPPPAAFHIAGIPVRIGPVFRIRWIKVNRQSATFLIRIRGVCSDSDGLPEKIPRYISTRKRTGNVLPGEPLVHPLP